MIKVRSFFFREKGEIKRGGAWAAIFAILFGVLWEKGRHFFLGIGFSFTLMVVAIFVWFVLIFVVILALMPKRPTNHPRLSQKAIRNYVKSELDGISDEQLTAELYEADAIENRANARYTDKARKFLVTRRIYVQRLLNGRNVLCSMMGKRLYERVDFEKVDVVLSVEKTTDKTNAVFINSLLDHAARRIRRKDLRFYESTGRMVFTAEESVRGQNVLVVQCVHIFPTPLQEVIRWVKSEGGNVVAVVVMFDCSSGTTKPEDLGIEEHQFIAAARIDLGLEAHNEEANARFEVKTLRFDDY